MTHEDRKAMMRAIQDRRAGRCLVCFLNFDRASDPKIPGLSTIFAPDAKEALFRTLKESDTSGGIDLFLYTRGGDINAVWPIASLLREFDPSFEVLVPFRCHSSGTLLALGAQRIILTPLSELSPIDPTVANQFNPTDPRDPAAILPIAVEDVEQYCDYIASRTGLGEGESRVLPLFIEKLVDRTHPLALGNVYRALQQIKQLARNILGTRSDSQRSDDEISTIVKQLSTQFFSHLHSINRHEVRQILGEEQAQFAPKELAAEMDSLLRAYEQKFELRKPFILNEKMASEPEKSLRLFGGMIETTSWSYAFETTMTVAQRTVFGPNVTVTLEPGGRAPLVPGYPREFQIEVRSQAWINNRAPKGVTT